MVVFSSVEGMISRVSEVSRHFIEFNPI